METLFSIVYWSLISLILISAFYYKTVKLYFYTVSCFKNIEEDERLQNLYVIRMDGKAKKNIKISIFNVMYIYVIIPEDVLPDLYLQYLQDHLKFIEEALSVQNLYGLVRTDKKRFMIPTEDGKMKNCIYLIKFIPILQGFGFKKFLLLLVVFLSLIITLNKFNIQEIVYNFIF